MLSLQSSRTPCCLAPLSPLWTSSQSQHQRTIADANLCSFAQCFVGSRIHQWQKTTSVPAGSSSMRPKSTFSEHLNDPYTRLHLVFSRKQAERFIETLCMLTEPTREQKANVPSRALSLRISAKELPCASVKIR